MATIYPAQIDNLTTLPSAIDLISPVKAASVNILRDAIFQIESTLGINPATIYGTVRNRLDVLEQTISGTGGSGNVISFGAANPGQTLVWNGMHWIPSTNFLNQNVQTSGEMVSGPALSTMATTGLNQLTGKLIFNAISPLKLSDPGQGIIYFDQTSSQFLISQNGGAYAPINTNGGTAGGDLSNTYPNPTVLKIHGATVPAAGSLITGNVLQVSGTGSLTYAPINLAGGTSYITGILPSVNQSSQSLGGDLSGNTTSAQVTGLQGVPLSPSSPSINQILQFNGTYWLPSTIVVGGDLSGTTSSATVIAIQSIPITSTTPTTDQVLQFNGTDWAPASITSSGTAGGDLSGTYPNPTVVKIQGNTFTSGSPTKGQFLVATTTSNYGPVTISGDITESGTTAGNLTVAALNGVVISGTPVSGQVLVSNSSATASWQNYSSFTGSGDLSGNSSSQTVIGIQGISVSATPPTSGQVLEYNGTAYIPTTPAGGSFTAGGDLSGTSSSQTVVGIQTIPVDATPPTNGQILQYNGTSYIATTPSFSTPTGTGLVHIISGVQQSTATLIVNADVSATAAIAGTKINSNFGSQTISTSGTLSVGGATVTSLQDSSLSTGIVHSDSSGNFTSSLLVNADVSASAAVAVSKLAAGTSAQILLNNSTPAPAWTTVSGDATIDNTGVVTVAGLQGNTFTSGSPTKGQFVVATTTSNYGPVTISGDITESSSTAGQLTVAAINGIMLSGTPSSGQVLTATSPSSANWQAAGAGSMTLPTVFQPSGTAEGNIFITESTLNTQLGSVFGPQTVYLDFSQSSNTYTATGDLNLGTFLIGVFNETAITVPTLFTNYGITSLLQEIKDVVLSTSGPTYASPPEFLRLTGQTTITGSGGSNYFYTVTGGSQQLEMHDFTSLGDAANAVIHITSTGTLNLVLFDSATVNANALLIDVGGTVNITIESIYAIIDQSYFSLSGVTISYASIAVNNNNGNNAKGASSIAAGNSSQAIGNTSTAFGNLTNANGDYSTAFGYITNSSRTGQLSVSSASNGQNGVVVLCTTQSTIGTAFILQDASANEFHVDASGSGYYLSMQIRIVAMATNASVGPATWVYEVLTHTASGIAIIDSQSAVSSSDPYVTGWLTSITVDGTTSIIHVNINPNLDSTNTIIASAEMKWAEVFAFIQ